MEKTYTINITCEGCVKRVEKVLSNIPDLLAFTVSLENHTVTLKGNEVALLEAEKRIGAIGYEMFEI